MMYFSIMQIENLFGVLKRRFPCLQRGLRLNLDTSLSVIVACGVLHNIAGMRRRFKPGHHRTGISALQFALIHGDRLFFSSHSEAG